MFERVGLFDRGDGYGAEVRHLTDARQSIHVTFPALHPSEGHSSLSVIHTFIQDHTLIDIHHFKFIIQAFVFKYIFNIHCIWCQNMQQLSYI